MSRLAVALGCCCLALPLLSGCGGDTSASSGQGPTYTPRVRQAEVEVAEARRQPLAPEAEFTGDLLPRRVSRVMAEIDGVVREVPQVGARFEVEADGKRYSEQLGITFGQWVREGDVLVRLDPREGEIDLRMAEAKLSKAKADLAKLQSWQRPEEVRRLTALRNEAKSRHEQAVRDRDRLELLYRRNAVAVSEYEKARMQADAAHAALDSAEADLQVGEAGPTEEEVAVQQALIDQAEAEVAQKKRRLEQATLRAPFDGVVTAFHVEVGDRVSPTSGPVADLMDLRYLVAEVGVPETYTGRVRVQDRAQVSAAGVTGSVPGLVVAVNEMVEPKTRTFRVRIAIDNASGQFKAGQFARVKLSLSGEGTAPLSVPSGSVVLVEGQPHVFVVEGDRVRQVPVQVGLTTADRTEIRAGLQEGDRVVTSDPGLLSDGMRVSVRGSAPGRAASR